MPDDLISRNALLREIMGRPPEAHYPDYYAAIVQQIPAVCSVVVGDTGLAVGNVDFEKLCKQIEENGRRKRDFTE